jgi:hypothetical protein
MQKNNIQINQSLDKKNSRLRANICEKSSKKLGKNKKGRQDLGPVKIRLPTEVTTSCFNNYFSYVQT